MEIIIREMVISDLEEVYELEVNCYQSPWTKEMFMSELHQNQYAMMFVLEIEKKIFGYGGMWIVLDAATITKVTIAQPLRGHGIGDVLLKDLLRRIDGQLCIDTTLEVRVSNTNAIKLYEKNGFLIIGTRKKYYSDGEDAYAMIRRKEGCESYHEETYISD